jgi:hypothetical protein
MRIQLTLPLGAKSGRAGAAAACGGAATAGGATAAISATIPEIWNAFAATPDMVPFLGPAAYPPTVTA